MNLKADGIHGEMNDGKASPIGPRLYPRESTVDSELTCPVLVAHHMSASSALVLLWDCGQRSSVVHISTGAPPSGFKRRFLHL
jgi:hypothetical protein